MVKNNQTPIKAVVNVILKEVILINVVFVILENHIKDVLIKIPLSIILALLVIIIAKKLNEIKLDYLIYTMYFITPILILSTILGIEFYNKGGLDLFGNLFLLFSLGYVGRLMGKQVIDIYRDIFNSEDWSFFIIAIMSSFLFCYILIKNNSEYILNSKLIYVDNDDNIYNTSFLYFLTYLLFIILTPFLLFLTKKFLARFMEK